MIIITSFSSFNLLNKLYKLFTDGRLHSVKRKPYSHIGYVGKKADKNGNVNDKITLYIPRTEIKKITLRTNFDRIIKEATIIAKTKTGQEITRYEITDNEKSELVIDMPAENVGVLELHIKKHTPNKRIWLISFYPGFEFFVDEKDIIKIKHQKKKTENKQGSIGRLYINSIDLELNNITRIYDEQNAESPIAGFFNSNAIVNVAIFLEHKKLEKTFSLKFGTYFVTEIKTSEEKPTVKIKAQDYIGLNKDIFLSLGILENTNAYECFGKIAQALNMSAHLDKNLYKYTLLHQPH
ncbi:MAG: hypothetical protein P1P59_05430 [Treponemataceae bacterium]